MSRSDKQTYRSTCSYCGVGCNVLVKKNQKGLIEIEPDKESPVNKGMLCSKGMNLHYVVNDKSDRLLFPQMRYGRNQPLQRVSWDAALTRAAAVFKSVINKYGPDAVAFYGSGQFLTEEYYILNKLVKGFIGTNNLDTNSRLCMSSAVAGYKLSLGEDCVPASYADIELADCFFITGANPAWCHPIIFRRIEAHKAANPEVKIIVADPRKTQTCSQADIHLQLNPGTDITLYNAIAKVIIEENFHDLKFIENHTEGFGQLEAYLASVTLQELAQECGVEAELIIKAARMIGNAKGFLSMWAMGLNQSVEGVNKNLSLINLSLITGKIGKPGNGPFSLTGQPNAMGGREVGGMANLCSAHRDLSNPVHRKEVADFWGVSSVPEKPGYTATDLFQAVMDEKVKAIWILCTNPSVSLPHSNLIEEALKKAKFVVVQDVSNKSDTLQFADLVLPAASWLEKEGTMTNSERRISYLSKVLDPPGEAMADYEILMRFAHKMGYVEGFSYRGSAEVYSEHAALTKNTNIDISGLDHQRLREEGSAQWPVPYKGHPGTPRLFTNHRFYTTNGKARILTVQSEKASEKTSPDFPLILTTGRVRDHWHTMTKTGKVQKLKQHTPTPFLEINPEDAAERGIGDNEPVVITGKRGKVQVTAKVTDEIKRGVVFLPMHWGKILNHSGGRANNLTNPLSDPRSKEPDLKFAAVEVHKYRKPRQKILVVGAGAAACRFVTEYRSYNRQDQIEVFCKEIHPFYNRVMLPEYVNGKQEWERLVKIKEEEFNAFDIKVHKGIEISNVNTSESTVTDSLGKEHSYDVLILASGSRSFVPRDVPRNLPGIFTMRSRTDADGLLKHTSRGSHVLVVGGGLLGLELASSLRDIDIEVTMVQRTSRLMERQLDRIGSELLLEEIRDRGINICLNDEVKGILGKEKFEGVRLASGTVLSCDAMVFAIGTEPNIEYLKGSEVICNRGVLVNEYMQTNVPNIYAVGEIAEFKSHLYGITAAAEEQASVLARYLVGDICNYYDGSLLMNILKVEGVNLCSIGTIEVPVDDPDYEEIIFLDKSRRYYKKCVVYRDKLIGAILIGDKSEFLEFKELIANKTELSDKRLQLLISSTGKEPVKGKLVCSCNNVGEGNLEELILKGTSSVQDLCKLSGAGTGCGSCRPEVKALFEKIVIQTAVETV